MNHFILFLSLLINGFSFVCNANPMPQREIPKSDSPRIKKVKRPYRPKTTDDILRKTGMYAWLKKHNHVHHNTHHHNTNHHHAQHQTPSIDTRAHQHVMQHVAVKENSKRTLAMSKELQKMATGIKGSHVDFAIDRISDPSTTSIKMDYQANPQQADAQFSNNIMCAIASRMYDNHGNIKRSLSSDDQYKIDYATALFFDKFFTQEGKSIIKELN